MPSRSLPQITRVAKRITSRLRPDRETMRLFPHGDAFHFACRCVDSIDHVVKASRKPQHLPVGVTFPISELPPRGMGHVTNILWVAKSITETLPLPRGGPKTLLIPRLATYSFDASRLG